MSSVYGCWVFDIYFPPSSVRLEDHYRGDVLVFDDVCNVKYTHALGSTHEGSTSAP